MGDVRWIEEAARVFPKDVWVEEKVTKVGGGKEGGNEGGRVG